MNKNVLRVSFFMLFLLYPISTHAQKIAVGGRGGLSFFSYGSGSSAGIQIGPTFDYEFQQGMYLGSELNVNTQGGTPVEWANYLKYYLPSSNATMQPYLDGGFGLWFLTGGPYFGIRAGGGVYFDIGQGLQVPADLQLGPVFTSGSTTFYLAITSGIRYMLP